MGHFAASSVAVLAVCFEILLASPIANPASPSRMTDDLLGFDENHQGSSSSVSISASDDDLVLPDIRILNEDNFANDTRAVATPYNPSTSHIQKLAKRFILGQQDNRELWDTSSFPFHSVGRLVWENGVLCSGALVGPRHVLTARHCLPDEPVSGSFTPGYDDGERFGSGKVVAALASKGQKPGSPCETKGDWAVLALDQKLGDKLGYFGVKNPDASMLGRPIFYNLGYPGDRDGGSRPYGMIKVSVLPGRTFGCDPTGPFYTDTDTAGGQSGSPHWEIDRDGSRWIWGALSIGVSWGEGQGYAGFSSGAQMVDAVSQLRKEYS